jgi:hypothetical protein
LVDLAKADSSTDVYFARLLAGAFSRILKEAAFFKVISGFDLCNLSLFARKCTINYLHHCGCASTWQSFAVCLYGVFI